MTADPHALRERVIQRLGYLIDLTRIIDRNREDGIFDNQGGTIHYVFDTNVAQMFFEPFRNPHYCEVFFGPLWGVDKDEDDEVNAQSCLIAAEYLFSGSLPGQKDSRWYMSALHREELGNQIDYLRKGIEQIDETLRTNARFRNDALYSLQLLNSALAFEGTDRDDVLQLAARSGIDAAGLEALARLPEREFEMRAVEIRSREVCRTLALDRVLEPRWQLDRFYTDPDMLPARHDLEALLGIESRGASLFREARDWQKALVGVLSRRGGVARSETAMRADCETLALISWASREALPSNERIVFVTGDRAILEAYKQRYVDEPGSGPFLLRPVNHFAPLFNPRSAQSMLSSKRFAFQALREALEGAMLALNLGLFNFDEPFGRLRARDHFSSKAEREARLAAQQLVEFFPAFRDDGWLARQERRLLSLVAQLRPIERLMIEAYPRLVAARLEERQGDFIAAIENAEEEVNRELVSQLKQAKRTGLRFSLPFMNEVVRDLLERITQREGDGRVRALIPLKLSFASSPDEFTFYAEELEKLRQASDQELEQQLIELAKTPPHIFALAAMLAFSLERWKDAARFAALGASASSSAARSGAPWRIIEDHLELSYLSAVATRFRLSAWDPAQALGYGDPLREWLLKAAYELGQGEAHYRRHGLLSRLLRTVSERASLYVSYCEWLTFGPLELAERQEDAGRLALEALDQVVSDLAECSALADPARVRAEAEAAQGSGGSKLVLDSATLQFSLNILGARLVGGALAERWPKCRPQVAAALGRLPVPRTIAWEGKPHLAEAYLAADAGDWETLQSIALDKVTLPLDRTIIRGLQARAGDVAAAAPPSVDALRT